MLDSSSSASLEQWTLNCPPPTDPPEASNINGLTLIPRHSYSPQGPTRSAHLRAHLSVLYPGVDFYSLSDQSIWLFINRFKDSIAKHSGLVDDNWTKYNFSNCLTIKGTGKLNTYSDGEQRVIPYRCCNKYCPECADNSAKRPASSEFDFIKAVAVQHNITKFWNVVFTLPQNLENRIEKGTLERDKIVSGIKGIINNIYGLNERDLLCAYCNIHAVGDDAGPMRTRFHFHVGFLPIGIKRDKKGKKPNAVMNLDYLDQLPFREMQRQWGELLESVFPGEVPSHDQLVIEPRFIPIKGKKAKWGKVRHRINYDLRGFGKDFLTAPILFNAHEGLAVVKAGKDYQIVSIDQLAKRWMFVRDQRDLRTWGILDRKGTYKKLLQVELIKEEEPTVIKEERVEIRRYFKKVYDEKTRRVRWKVEVEIFLETGEKLEHVQSGRRAFQVYQPAGGWPDADEEDDDQD